MVGSGSSAPALLLAASLIVGTPSIARALEVIELNVRHTGASFEIDFAALLDAPVEAVERVMRDYDAYDALDERIRNARVIDRPAPNVAIVHTQIRACAGIFCRTVDRTERVEERRHELLAVILPQHSDLRGGVTRTILAGEGERTRLIYHSHFEPDFWVPRWLGRGIASRSLASATRSLFESVEQRSHETAVR
jgi:Polyketide cyclase / dehydrase and lipid transport